MSDKKRNFWILLTMIAVILAAGKLIRSNQSHHSTTRVIIKTPAHCTPPSHRHRDHCKKKKRKKKRTCSSYHYSISPAIDDFVFVNQEPIVLNLKEVRHKIAYPFQNRGQLQNESIVARILVDQNGRYLRHRIISQTNTQLRSRCDKFLSNLRFAPAIRDGKAVRYWVNIQMNFDQ
ncbi:MAG: energy transducer TonB [Bacteroidota bacterium]